MSSKGALYAYRIQHVCAIDYGHGPLILDGYAFSDYSDAKAGWNLI